MKQIKNIMLIVLLTLVGRASADNLTVGKVAMSAGGTRQIAIELKNADKQYEAFQFDLVLPEGITIAKNEKGKPDATLNAERKADHSLTVQIQEDNSYRFLSYSMDDMAFKGTSGALVYVTLEAKEGLSLGDKEAVIKSQVFTDITGEVSKWDDTTFLITIEEPSTVTANSYERVYGEENPKFEYSVEGGALNGTPEITCEATATSPVGTYDIIISQGSVTNTNVTYVKGTLTVTKAPLTIKAGEYTRKQGEENPEFTLSYEGFKNNEAKDVLTKQPTVTCEATKDSEPGEYAITVSGAEAQNYDISYVAGKLTVMKADPVVVTAKSYSREYGEKNPEFEYTSEGAALSGVPEISCEATEKSPVGDYTIVIKKGTVTNYNDSYVNGTLTVTKAHLTIKVVGEYTRKQGEENPEFKLEYDGFKNGETEEVLTKKPVITCTATKDSEPGVYEVVVSGAEAQNYDISYVAGKLTVTKADPVVVTAKSYSREYGEENPKFEYSAEGGALSGTPEITCEATATSPAGTYDIIISQGSVTNYNVTYVKGTLTITKAPLTIKAGDYTRMQGEENPEFTLSYEGFKNNETEAVLTKQPVISCSAIKDSEPGVYEVIVSGAEARNYEISYVNGLLTIEALPVIPGDANGDGTVNAADIVEVVNYIMKNPSWLFDASAADVNGDGVVNAADIVEMVKIIMAG